ncbi:MULTISPECIES: hypothetical protein [Gammaproteobacteria]|uniref:hypothetical protein n=1 Tax=Gammaproteobacteria TaxID=1236 RepID=UPI000DD0A28F|nr:MULTISPECIES: hypothetical protein [Gammaproteobacteria]RTE85789.1 hypothetical protein DQX04_10080 [Aliidiomarina sp. B3213]TCZ90209.1 hypothetical protein EYQ95_10375 [Lysobacter sp. N42]
MMPYGSLVEYLLSGQFVCEVTAPEMHQKLAQDDVRNVIDEYLRPLNRRVAQSEDGAVYFLAWNELTPEIREQLKQQFSTTMHALLPLLDWMQIVQESLGKDGTIAPGDTIKLHEFVQKTEDHQGLRQRFGQLAADKFFNSQAEQLDAQAKTVFKRLKEHGYLTQPHADRQYYIATGKVDYLIELVRFIKDEENLPVEESSTQEELWS